MVEAAPPERYVLATGNAGAERLRLLQSIYGSHMKALLDRAGPRAREVDADDSILLLLPKMWQVFGRNAG